VRPGRAPASAVTRAAAATILLPGTTTAPDRPLARGVPWPGIYSRASTGRHTGRVHHGRLTTIPTVTKQVPKLSFARAGAEASCCQHAPNTLRPDRRNTESSTATVTAPPAGTSSPTTSRATARPSSSRSHTARAKK
jgi:hypothetical protein